MKALEAHRTITDLLASQHIEEPQAKAKALITHAAGDDIFADIDDKAWSKILSMANRVGRGEPVEYITGKAYFRYLELDVNPDVLIPRKETELVAAEAIELIRSCGFKTALDMCTGSGCIAISIATETDAQVMAADVSEKAIEVAERNVAANNAGVGFIVSDMFENVDGTYDIIVCNPPYISEAEYEGLNADVKNFEPELALKVSDGLEFYRRLAKQAPQYLNGGGALVLEIGAEQAEDVEKLLNTGRFSDIETKKDYQERDRIVTALWR